MKKTLLFIIACAGLSACNKEVSNKIDQDKIWTYYLLHYDQNTDITYASATFRFSSQNGTRLMLSDPSNVLVDGSEMEFNDQLGLYEFEFSGKKDSAEFIWTDLDGLVFKNKAFLREVSFPAILADTLFQADSVSYFMWEGAALDSFESIQLTIDGTSDTDARIFKADTLGATFITIDSLTLRQVTAGQASLILEKSYSPPLSEQTARGGLRLGKFRAADRTIQVK